MGFKFRVRRRCFSHMGSTIICCLLLELSLHFKFLYFYNKFCLFLLVLMNYLVLITFLPMSYIFLCFRYYLVLCCSYLTFTVLLLVPKVHHVVLVKHSFCSYFCLMFIMLLPCVAATLCSLCCFVVYCIMLLLLPNTH